MYPSRRTGTPTAAHLNRPREPHQPRIGYDAAYVALAEALKAPLVTLDRALAEMKGVTAEIELHA
jgi:hypothetical protein